MKKIKGLGQKALGGLVIIGLVFVLTGCCNYGMRCGNSCTWPNVAWEMGVKATPPMGCGPCAPCQCYDPCYPFGSNSRYSNSNNGGEMNNSYLSQSQSSGNGNNSYY